MTVLPQNWFEPYFHVNEAIKVDRENNEFIDKRSAMGGLQGIRSDGLGCFCRETFYLAQKDSPARSIKYKGISEVSDHSKHTILLLHLLRYYYTWAKAKWRKMFWISSTPLSTPSTRLLSFWWTSGKGNGKQIQLLLQVWIAKSRIRGRPIEKRRTRAFNWS